MPKATGEGANDTLAAVPVPVSATVCGLNGASSATLTLAFCSPVFVGANFTPTLHPLPAAIVFAPSTQAVPLVGAPNVNCDGLAPVNVMPVMCSAAVPVLLIATFVTALLVPVRWFPNATFTGLNVTAGAPAPAVKVKWKLVVPPELKTEETMKKYCVPEAAAKETCDWSIPAPALALHATCVNDPGAPVTTVRIEGYMLVKVSAVIVPPLGAVKLNHTLFAAPPLTDPAGAQEGIGSVAPVFAVARIVFSVVENGAEPMFVAAENASFAGTTLEKSKPRLRVPPAPFVFASVTIR